MPFTRSPLRYPGGKTQLASYIDHLLKINKINKNGTYIEPFAGGFGVGLKLVEDNCIAKAVINDLDPSIFSFWYFILYHPNEFIFRIKNTPVTIGEWYKQKNIHSNVMYDKFSINNAFSTFFLNRTNISGIISGGPIGGKEQKSRFKIDCRFNKESLIKKIKKISSVKKRIELSNSDANVFIVEKIMNYNPENTFIFFDPPYFGKGEKLYLSFVNKKEHKQLSKNILSLKNYKWITTYDKRREILDLYKSYSKAYKYCLRYSANKKREAEEYMFASKNLKINSYGKVNIKSIN